MDQGESKLVSGAASHRKVMAQMEEDGNLPGRLETPDIAFDRGANLESSLPAGVCYRGLDWSQRGSIHSFHLFALSHIGFSRTFFLKSHRRCRNSTS
jgi:hypothetical protein